MQARQAIKDARFSLLRLLSTNPLVSPFSTLLRSHMRRGSGPKQISSANLRYPRPLSADDYSG
jgi:hypothetical protein